MGRISLPGTGIRTKGVVEICAGVAAGLIRQSVSTGTWKVYSKVWQKWFSLQEEVGGSDDPEEMQAWVLFFICSNYEKGVSRTAIGKKMAALAFLFQLVGHMYFTKSFVVCRALRGYRKGSSFQDSRRPVSFEVLGTILASLGRVCSLHYQQVLFRAAFVLAFFGAFRVSELVSPSRRVVGGLLFQDIQSSDKLVTILVRHSKTDQQGKGVRVELFMGNCLQLCPVTALQQFLGVCPLGDGALFVHQNWACLSRFQFTARLP